MSAPTGWPPPRDWWRDVPCGHPPDPVCRVDPDGEYVCHCGHGLPPGRWLFELSRAVPDVGGFRVVPCDRCGCAVACPP